MVTAAYPTGGYNGFYLQTPGTGGPTDATPGASDAVFVYGSAATAKVAIGDHVQVTGEVSEYHGTTEVTPAAASDVVALDSAAEPVQPLAVTDWSSLDTPAEKEAHEGELLDVETPFTVADVYNTNYYGSITLAAGTKPLIQPTDVVPASDTAGIAAINADNAARMMTLDDGASTNFNSSANKTTPLPYLSAEHPVRVGSAVTFDESVILEFRNDLWTFEPTSAYTADEQAPATFSNTRTAAPENVGGDIRIGTFNVLNYFPTTGEKFDAAGGSCSYYNDRAGNHITVNDCGSFGPRGAADQTSLERQQAKIVAAINDLGASVVSLEEIENSAVMGVSQAGDLGLDRDDALAKLVAALNTAAGSQKWAYVPSPAPADLPALSEQDVIRTAFIYQPSAVEPVGASQVLVGAAAFSNAREPLAQAFKATGAPDSDAFGVIVNHFKSKGSGVDDGTGQGNANPDRVAQAHALADFADGFAGHLSGDLGASGAVFLTGDYNSYTHEDPLNVLYDDGYTNIASSTPGESTYVYGGLSGSLDHVLANAAALPMVTGADVWNINSVESVALEYSRYNYNATDFYRADAYRASDHDPEVVGVDLPDVAPAEPVASTVTAPPVKVRFASQGKLPITVSADGVTPTGTVEVQISGRTVSADLVDGKATVVLPRLYFPGTRIATVSYSGDDAVAPSSTTTRVRVTLW